MRKEGRQKERRTARSRKCNLDASRTRPSSLQARCGHTSRYASVILKLPQSLLLHQTLGLRESYLKTNCIDMCSYSIIFNETRGSAVALKSEFLHWKLAHLRSQHHPLSLALSLSLSSLSFIGAMQIYARKRILRPS